MGLFKNEINQFGLDIGTTGIRLVEVKAGRAGLPLKTYGAVAIDPKVARSDAEVDQLKLIEAIKKLVHDAKASTKNVVAGIPSDKIFASVINLPKMSQQELAKSIKYQADQYIPMPLDQVKLDWAVVSEPEAKEMEVLLVATQTTVAERYLNLLERAGLEVIALEPDAAALARSLVYTPDIAVVLMNLGGSSTDLVVVHNSSPKLIRSIPIGSETFVKAAAQNLGLEEDQASQFVYKFGLTQTKLEGQVKKAISAGVDSLLGELDKSNKFFLSRNKNVKIEKVVITGKASSMPEFPTYVANSVGLPVEIGNPWSRISTPVEQQGQLNELASQFGVAAGLAIRGLV